DRTSPVQRGKWIMEVLLGSPPPAPPPNVPPLEDVKSATEAGRTLSTRERMEEHRKNPACASCHRVIDPLGLALENFDVVGAWRIKDSGAPVDTAATLYDGTPISGPASLRAALLGRSETVVRNFTENLLAYALGGRAEGPHRRDGDGARGRRQHEVRSVEASLGARDGRPGLRSVGDQPRPARTIPQRHHDRQQHRHPQRGSVHAARDRRRPFPVE